VAFVAGTAFASLSDIPRFSFPMPRRVATTGRTDGSGNEASAAL
jgi:hypothetical protein